MTDNVTPLRMTPDRMLRRIRDLAAESENVFFTAHARTRMLERRISTTQVLDVLRQGGIVEGPAPDIRGNWRCTMRRFTAGVELHVAVAIEDGLLVITVY